MNKMFCFLIFNTVILFEIIMILFIIKLVSEMWDENEKNNNWGCSTC